MQYTNSPFFELAKTWRYINLKLRYSDFDLTYGWLIPCSFQLWKKSIFQKVANFPFIFWTGETVFALSPTNRGKTTSTAQ